MGGAGKGTGKNYHRTEHRRQTYWWQISGIFLSETGSETTGAEVGGDGMAERAAGEGRTAVQVEGPTNRSAGQIHLPASLMRVAKMQI